MGGIYKSASLLDLSCCEYKYEHLYGLQRASWLTLFQSDLRQWHRNGVRAWSRAKSILQLLSARIELVARAFTITVIAERDVGGGTETVRVWSIDTDAVDGGHRARSAAEVSRQGTTVDDGR